MTLTEALELQLARLRTRYARTPLPRFFAWWGTELAALLPLRWRALLAERADALLLDVTGRELVVWRQSAQGCAELGRVNLDDPAEAQKSAFARLRDALEAPDLRRIYCIDGARTLRRSLSLPAAAEDNLRQVLAFEMDRQTPFKAEQVYFDYRLAPRAAAGRNLHVELTVVPRAQLDAELAAIAGAAPMLDGVDCWTDARGGTRLGLNLLSAERRYARKNLRLRLNLALGAAATVLLVTCMLLWLGNRQAALDAMQADVARAQNEAKQVSQLRKTLQDTIDSANFLNRKKHDTPLMVDLLEDLTKRLPDDTYLERLNVDDKNKIELQGLSDDASKLIGLLNQSALLANPSVQGTIQPDPRTKKDRFNITLDFRAIADAQAAAAKSATAKAAAARANGGTHAPGQ
ncbi:MAG: PilN domain-containing protein [Xanthomonadaceae bacterium]|nr:PilN domain-containing protein [Xanthomonadaceae bacterium]MDE2085006.1 PilN domain-containing protein [Xanthomonadaceae bacterium]